jgi:ferredoxin
MNVSIQDTCTACGLCCDTCPEVFDMGDDIAEVFSDNISEELKPVVQHAAEECPVAAIMIDD